MRKEGVEGGVAQCEESMEHDRWVDRVAGVDFVRMHRVEDNIWEGHVEVSDIRHGDWTNCPDHTRR